jgi:hypothetical protein
MAQTVNVWLVFTVMLAAVRASKLNVSHSCFPTSVSCAMTLHNLKAQVNHRLLYYVPFDDVSEKVQIVRDFSSQSNMGYLGFNSNKENSDPAVVTGKRERGLLFDGIDDRVTVPHSTKLLLSGQSFSISLFFLLNRFVDKSENNDQELHLLSKHWTHRYREWGISLSTDSGDPTAVRIYTR